MKTKQAVLAFLIGLTAAAAAVEADDKPGGGAVVDAATDAKPGAASVAPAVAATDARSDTTTTAATSTAAAPVTVAATDSKPDAAAAKAPPARSQLWSYQPVKRPDVPAVHQKKWVRTPIDAFVLAKLEAKGLKPSVDADRAAFVRRATLDVWGVIPTPEQVKAFVGDRSPDAYE